MDEMGTTLSTREIMQGQYLSFSVGKDEFAMPIVYVNEIINVQAITEVPNLPPYIKGIINLRGKIVPVMDVRLRFNLAPKAYDDRTCIIVTEIHETDIGLIVDTVREVINIADEAIVPPSLVQSQTSRFVSGIGKAAVGSRLILDCEHLVADDLAGG